MAIVSAITNFVVGFILLQTCLIVWTAVLFPQLVLRARLSIERTPARTFTAGLAGLLAALVLLGGLLLLRMPCIHAASQFLSYLSTSLSVNRFSNDAYMIVHGFGWMLLGPFFCGWAVGQAALADLFTCRLRQQGWTRNSISGLVVGAFSASAAAFLPVIGWFGFFPLMTLMSLGAGICALLPARYRNPFAAEQGEVSLDIDQTATGKMVSAG